MGLRIACLNPGSSSVKASLLDGDSTLTETSIDSGSPSMDLAAVLPADIDGVAVRIVHGGPDFRGATLVDGTVLRRLRDLAWLAPLHNPAALALIDRVRELRPDVPIVGCFDTAFHATLPEAAATYPVPRSWTTMWGLKRYGFHGLSHAYASRRTSQLLGGRPSRLVSCHLGAGASLCAIRDGVSVDTTMGFTPMEGLMMATRSGSIDPGIILLALREGLSVDDVERQLEHASGLFGLAGSADFRTVATAADGGDEAAVLAVSVYHHRLVQGAAAMAASLGGIDALVFTGGVGENQASLRQRVCAGIAFLGVALTPDDSDHDGQDRALPGEVDAVKVLVIHAREDLEMARQAGPLLARKP